MAHRGRHALAIAEQCARRFGGASEAILRGWARWGGRPTVFDCARRQACQRSSLGWKRSHAGHPQRSGLEEGLESHLQVYVDGGGAPARHRSAKASIAAGSLVRMARIMMHGERPAVAEGSCLDWHRRMWRAANTELTASWRADPVTGVVTCPVCQANGGPPRLFRCGAFLAAALSRRCQCLAQDCRGLTRGLEPTSTRLVPQAVGRPLLPGRQCWLNGRGGGRARRIRRPAHIGSVPLPSRPEWKMRFALAGGFLRRAFRFS